jgi:hypothetical protein
MPRAQMAYFIRAGLFGCGEKIGAEPKAVGVRQVAEVKGLLAVELLDAHVAQSRPQSPPLSWSVWQRPLGAE